jgi:hypothetical protein
MTAPAYKLAKLMSAIITHVTPLQNTFNLRNSVKLMEELKQIPDGQNIRLASFDVKNMYTNIPTSELPKILKTICTLQDMTTTFTRELIKLVRLVLKQNYFSFVDSKHLQKQDLAMGRLHLPFSLNYFFSIWNTPYCTTS